MTTGRLLALLGGILLFWLGIRYLLPFFLPFILGALAALAAEPAVRFLSRRLPRAAAAGVGVTATFLVTLGLLSLLGAVAVKELGRLAGAVPDLANTAQQGLAVLEDWLTGVAERAPEGIRPLLTRTVLHTFDGGAALAAEAASRIPRALTAVLGQVPDSALSVGVGILSAFLISARLPLLRQKLAACLPEQVKEKAMPVLRQVRPAVLGWLRAQGTLMLITWAIVGLGLLLLRVPYALLWAVGIAAVDAVPMLGTGIILLPWSLICLLQSQPLRALGLGLLFVAATLTRTTLEPRLVGRQLGLDPLVTLIALYAGYRLWGFWGLLLAPMATAVVKRVLSPTE